MFEFKKLCDAYENLSPVEKGFILTEKSVKILAKLYLLDLPNVNPVETLAGFIIGSAVADGKINEQEYLLMYSALVKTFGKDFRLSDIKESFLTADGREIINVYTKEMIKIFDYLDEDLKEDIIILCLCITAIDGKVSLKEKNYIKRLYKA